MRDVHFDAVRIGGGGSFDRPVPIVSLAHYRHLISYFPIWGGRVFSDMGSANLFKFSVSHVVRCILHHGGFPLTGILSPSLIDWLSGVELEITGRRPCKSRAVRFTSNLVFDVVAGK